jgi:hypothetical protein
MIDFGMALVYLQILRTMSPELYVEQQHVEPQNSLYATMPNARQPERVSVEAMPQDADKTIPAHTQHIRSISLRFCYQDQQLRPYYLGDGNTIASPLPGATIEHVQQLVHAFPEIELELVRLPWLRCLKALQQGDVDAVVANYHASRTEFAVYPMLDMHMPDPQLAFAEQAICLVSQRSRAKRWNGHSFTGLPKITILRDQSSPAYAQLKDSSYASYQTLSGVDVLAMLQQGRADASLKLCEVAGVPIHWGRLEQLELTLLQPAVYRLSGYLIFSKNFYQHHPSLVQSLWQHQQHIDVASIYRPYIDMLGDEGVDSVITATETVPPAKE